MKIISNKKNTEKKRNYKIPVIISIITALIAIIGVLRLNPNIISRITDTNNYDYELKYDDFYDPGRSYYIRIDTKTKALLVETKNYCSAVNCRTSTDIYGPTILTSQEYSKIFSYIKSGGNKRYIVSIFESLARDQEPFDGSPVINSKNRREFANKWLDGLIEEENK